MNEALSYIGDARAYAAFTWHAHTFGKYAAEDWKGSELEEI